MENVCTPMKSTWTGGLNQTEGAKHWQCAIINDCHGECGTGDYFSTYCMFWTTSITKQN